MSPESSKTSSAAVSLWPKVLLWVVVLLIGFLYVWSVTQVESQPASGPEEPAAAGAQQPAESLPDSVTVPDSAAQAESEATSGDVAQREPAWQTAIETVVAPAEDEAPTNVKAEQPLAPEPQQAPSAGLAPGQPASAEPSLEPAGLDTRPGETQAVQAEANKAESQVEPSPAKFGQEEKPSEAEALAPRGAGGQAQEPVASDEETPAAGAEAEPAQAAAAAPMPTAVEPTPAPSLVPSGVNERRAKIMAEYQAMRKAAAEEWKRRWERRGVPSPQAPYGGAYPGYAYPRAPYPYQAPSLPSRRPE